MKIVKSDLKKLIYDTHINCVLHRRDVICLIYFIIYLFSYAYRDDVYIIHHLFHI